MTKEQSLDSRFKLFQENIIMWLYMIHYLQIPLKMELFAGTSEILLDALTGFALSTHKLPRFLTGMFEQNYEPVLH